MTNHATLNFKSSLLNGHSNTSELVSKLKDLHSQLSKLDQELVDTTSISEVRKELVARSIIGSKDKAVRALAACCIADVLRLFAPDAPYTENELKDIFDLFVKQLKYIKEPNNPYFSYYYYLLESLSTIKSVVLLTDIGAEDIILELFECFFQIISLESSKNVFLCFLDILAQVIEESGNLSESVLECILSQFKRKRQREAPAATKLATDVCLATSDRLQRYVCQYFSQILIESSRELENEDSDLSALSSAHILILEIHKLIPSILLSVIPQLEEELKVDFLPIRSLATETLGEMFSSPESTLMTSYERTWKTWMDRRHDKSISIRLLWLKYASLLLDSHYTLDIQAGIRQKLLDPEDKVRTAAIQVLDELNVNVLENLSLQFLQEIALRCRDKKLIPRMAAIHSISRVFNVIYKLRETESTSYQWIPGAILDCLYTNDQDTQVAVEECLHTHIFPIILDDAKRTTRLIWVYSGLNSKQRIAFKTCLDWQNLMISNLNLYLEYCQSWNGGVEESLITLESRDDPEKVKSSLDFIIQHLSQKMPDPKRAQQALVKFSELNDRSIYRLMKNMMDPSADYKYILKHFKEIIKRLNAVSSLLGDVFTIFLRRGCVTLVGKNSVPILLDTIASCRHSKDVNEIEMGQTAECIIKDISLALPAIYKTCTFHFIQLVQQDKDDEIVGDALEALARLVKALPDKEILNEIKNISTDLLEKTCSSANQKQVKNATIILLLGEYQGHVSTLLKKIQDNLHIKYLLLPSSLTSLNQIIKYSESLVDLDDHSIDFFFNILRMDGLNDTFPLSSQDKKELSNQEWLEKASLDVLGKLKLKSLQILVQYVRKSCHQDVLFTRVYEFLFEILNSDGIIAPNTFPSTKSRLVLLAGKSILSLASIESYKSRIQPSISLVLVIQDPLFNVRSAFIEYLCKCIRSKQLDSNFIALIPFVAHEPELELKTLAARVLSSLTKNHHSIDSSKSNNVESQFVRLLHLLSHHPDISMQRDDIAMFSTYIEFYLNAVANPSNVAYFYYMAAKIKMYQDAQSPDSQYLYLMSELAQYCIQNVCSNHGWTLPSFTGNPKLPKDLFTKIPTPVYDVYLPEEFLNVHNKFKPVLIKEEKMNPKKRYSGSACDSASASVIAIEDDSVSALPPPPPPKRNASRKAKKKRVKVDSSDEENMSP